MKSKILELCKEINSEINMDTDGLIKNGWIDSFGFISLIAMLEENFRISIDIDEYDADNFESVDAIEKMLREFCGEKNCG